MPHSNATKNILEDLQFFFPSSVFGRAVESAIQKDEANLDSISYLADNTASSILICDASCKVRAVSKSFEAYVGHERLDLLGRNPSMMQGEKTTEASRADFRRLIKDRKQGVVSIVNYTAAGQPFLHTIHLVPLLAPKGELLSFLGVHYSREYLLH